CTFFKNSFCKDLDLAKQASNQTQIKRSLLWLMLIQFEKLFLKNVQIRFMYFHLTSSEIM
ncbi:MAG: hypothetical protein AAFQ57_07780, partial [Cyanobacteria bacterium J06626_14]